MKLDARRVEGFLADPGSCRLVLLHGEDAGLIRERGTALVRRVAGDVRDPFLVAELERDGLARLSEEMAAQSLIGGRRVVRVRDVTDGAAAFVQAALATRGEALLVLEAGELAARSKLRALAEAAPDAVAIACYAEHGPELGRTITRVLQAAGMTADAEAISYLADTLGNDRAVTRQELEKLMLYVGPGGRIDLEAAATMVGDLAGLQVEDALYAATAGDTARADRALALALGEGASPISVLRSMLMHLHRLERLVAAMQGGQAASDAVRAMRPPVFFARQPALIRAAGVWTADGIAAAAAAVWEAEFACKQTGAPAVALCRHTMLSVARRAAGRAR